MKTLVSNKNTSSAVDDAYRFVRQTSEMRKMRNQNYDMMLMMRSIAGISLFSGEGTQKL
jgi:hypothetical protein